MSRNEEKEGEIVQGKGEDEGKERKEHVKLHPQGEAKFSRNSDRHEGEEKERQESCLVEKAPSERVQVISAACQSSPSQKEGGFAKDMMIDQKDTEENYHQHHHKANNRFYSSYEQQGTGSLQKAFLSLTLVLANLIWSVALTYWNFQMNNFFVALASFVITVLSGTITSLAFFTTRSSPSCTARTKLAKWSRIAWLLAAIPCLAPVMLASAYFISSLVQKRGDSEDCHVSQRKTSKSCASTTSPTGWLMSAAPFHLAESLTLCFPMSVLHLFVLLENHTESFPTLHGVFTLLGLFLYSFSITFFRFQYDCLYKRDRFGDGPEMYLRLVNLWSVKLIWIVTYAFVIVTARLLYPEWKMEALVVAVAALTTLHEIPLWIALWPRCGKLAGKLSDIFFLIPQFTSLVSLIYWVNIDPTVYDTNIGSFVLGVYFWAEVIVLCAWLADADNERDGDLVPFYPHLMGDLISNCCAQYDPQDDQATDCLIHP